MSNETCSVTGCEKPKDSRGLCKAHYTRVLRTGNVGSAWTQTKFTDPLERIRSLTHVDPETACWVYRGKTRVRGYGRVYVNGKMVMAHRFMYEHYRGEIPNGLFLDHICRNRACVNPEHLEIVTSRENTRRSVITPASINRNKTHCKFGHEFNVENTYVMPRGYRACRVCHRLRTRVRRARQRNGKAA